MNVKAVWELVRDTFKDWGEDQAARLGAALAYYAIFSVGPLLVVVIAIAGRVFGDAAARGQIVGTVEGFIGREGAVMIQSMVESAGEPTTSLVATMLGTATLLLGAMGIFGQLKNALNTIWEVKPKKGGILAVLLRNVLSFAMVVALGFLLLVSLVVNAALAALSEFLRDKLPGGTLVWQVVNYVVMLAVVTLMFALIFKVLPDVRVAWKDVWLGALITAVLFLLGQVAIGLYTGLANVGSAFGAAGSLVIILVWIYYSAQIMLFGAEITQVYANKYGSGAVPSEHAEFITDNERAEQGLKPKARVERSARRRELRPSPWFR